MSVVQEYIFFHYGGKVTQFQYHNILAIIKKKRKKSVGQFGCVLNTLLGEKLKVVSS